MKARFDFGFSILPTKSRDFEVFSRMKYKYEWSAKNVSKAIQRYMTFSFELKLKQ